MGIQCSAIILLIIYNERFRIIGSLDLKGSNIIKGRRFEGLRVISDLEDFISSHSPEDYIDEFCLNNITGSLYDTNLSVSLLASFCKSVNLPITAQGGIQDYKDIESMLISGASRVAINTAIIADKLNLSTLVSEFGSQAIIFAPAIRIIDSMVHLYGNAGRELFLSFTFDGFLDFIASIIDRVFLSSIFV